MAAPNGTTWGGIAGGYGRVGIYVGVSSNATTTTVTVSTWFWSKYSVSDGYYSYYYNNDATSATTLINRSESIKTTVDTGTGWSTSNQVKLGETTYTYSRGTSDVTRNCAVKLTNIDRVGAAMTHTRSYTIPKLASYTISYNANGGSGAPGNQTKWHGKTLTLSSTKPTRTGYSFQGWALTKANADAGTWYYSAGGTCGKDENLTLYATWKANTYTVKYDANGGTGAPGNQTKTYGVTLKLSTTKPTRTNYNFLGWATSKTATTAAYAAGANYTANSATTLYAVWELAYVKPRITNPIAVRCKLVENEDGTSTYEPSDEGTYSEVSFDYACDRTVTEIKIEWESGKTAAKSITIPVTETIGSIKTVIGEGTLSPDYTYVVRIFVTDEVDFTKVSITLNGMNLPVDVLIDPEEGPKGISFGKPAELEGKADFEYQIYPRNGFSNILLEPETDFDTLIIPNTYIGENTTTYNYVNCPISDGTFSLKVESGGKNGQIIQTLTSTVKTSFEIWKRFYYTGTWGDWVLEYTGEGTLLWSGGYYMTAGHTVNLSQKISTQPNGIILVFNFYNNEIKNSDTHSFPVHKHLVKLHSGIGHNFIMMQGDTSGTIARKYLYIYDDRITGNDVNNKTQTIGGVTFTNGSFVLRYVIGV